MPALQALIFDVDGTLAETERDGHRIAFNQAFAEAGLDWDWTPELYGELLKITGGKERIRHYLDRWQPTAPEVEDQKAWIASLHAAKNARYHELLHGGQIGLRPGVERLLLEAREAGLTLAIATTTTPENVLTLLRCTLGEESIGWFAAIGAGDVVPAKKPAPDIYTHVLKELQLEPEVCLAFEDTAAGLKSATGADLATFITQGYYSRDHDFTGAIAVLDGLGHEAEPCQVIAGPDYLAPAVRLEALVELHASQA